MHRVKTVVNTLIHDALCWTLDGICEGEESCRVEKNANRPRTPSTHTFTLREYGLTVGGIQRYKIQTGTCLFDYVLIVQESAPAYPTLREWRNWQTRET